jgi:hypothetical protein
MLHALIIIILLAVFWRIIWPWGLLLGGAWVLIAFFAVCHMDDENQKYAARVKAYIETHGDMRGYYDQPKELQ